jgi:hypothetical protein
MSNLKAEALTAMSLLLVMAGVVPCEAKRGTFLTPTYEKMTDGASPDTNDISASSAPNVDAKPIKTATLTNPLAPISLSGDAGNTTLSSGAASAEGGVLKMEVSATGFAPKGPIDMGGKNILAPKSISTDKIGRSGILKQASQVNVLPLPLMESADEAEQKENTVLSAEQKQLSDLWESALTRSPDIQFVVQKLMPTNNPGHANTVMLRMLNTALFTAMNAATMMAPSPGMMMMNQGAGSLIGGILGSQESKMAKNARLSQTEGIMLFTIVRNTADKLVENYRNYKKTINTREKADGDLGELQTMVSEAKMGQDPAKQVEMDYTVKRAQREVEALTDDVKKYRQTLVDLAGAEAVAKLDKQVEDERLAVKEINASPTLIAAPKDDSNESPERRM